MLALSGVGALAGATTTRKSVIWASASSYLNRGCNSWGPSDRRIRMTISPEVADLSGMPPAASGAVWPQSRPCPRICDHRDRDLGTLRARGEADDEILARAAIFRGVEPGAVAAFPKQLHPVVFRRGYVIFTEG